MDDIGDQLNYLQSDVEVRNNKASNSSTVKIINSERGGDGNGELTFQKSHHKSYKSRIHKSTEKIIDRNDRKYHKRLNKIRDKHEMEMNDSHSSDSARSKPGREGA